MKKVVFYDVNFWFSILDAGLSAEDVARLIVEVPKSTEIVDIVVEKGNKVFVFKNYSSHIDCRIVGVRTVTLFRLVK